MSRPSRTTTMTLEAIPRARAMLQRLLDREPTKDETELLVDSYVEYADSIVGAREADEETVRGVHRALQRQIGIYRHALRQRGEDPDVVLAAHGEDT